MDETVNNVISFSGGKDSTAMVLEMLERGEKIHSVMAFDTGWEFPQMLEHWERFEEYTGLEIIKLYPKKPFEYWMIDRPVCHRGEPEPYRIGNGWPSPMRRWCTREKMKEIRKYLKNIDGAVSCVGFAADEAKRVGSVSGSDIVQRFPLIEYDIDEAEALTVCRKHGFEWGGLYDHFRRVSCFCCPLQRDKDLKILREHYPELWGKMINWDIAQGKDNIGFKGNRTVCDYEDIFTFEDKQIELLF